MTYRRWSAALIAVLALVAVTGLVVPSAALPGADPAPDGDSDVSAAEQISAHQQDTPIRQQDTPTQQQASGTCNYETLYDETIDSVVTIQRSGGGQGSGFVLDVAGNGSDQYVITNAHVAGSASSVTVQFNDGETRTGSVVGTDAASDLAVVDVQVPNYVDARTLADETDHGQKVAALGSPFGLDATITHGIVSGLDRSMPTNRGYTIPNVVQTDAPISPGNSGGPLVACNGAVVGVNTAGIAAQGAENIGFAIPASTVERVVPSLVENGEFNHPTLGITGVTLTPAVAEVNDLDVDQGVLVAQVSEDAPVSEVLQGSDERAQVGERVVPVGGDVIVAVEGESVANGEDVASVLLAESRPGDEVELTIVRDGEETTVTTTVIERPEPETGTP